MRLGSWSVLLFSSLFLILFVSHGNAVVLRNPSFKIPWEKALGLERKARQLSPVIFIPGDGGSQLEAKLDKPSVVHYICAQKSNWFQLWLNVEQLLPLVLDCFIDNMRLVYNNETKQTENSPGVEIRIKDFGNSSSVEYLAASKLSVSKYFVDIANMMVAHGYTRDLNIRAAPFDFRKAPNELGDYFVALKKLIMETYEMNGQTPVTFVAHSMGNLVGLYFLQRQPDAWKAKYMRAFISLAAPWAGAVKGIKAFTSGDNLNVAIISAFRVRAEQRSNPSLTFLFPSDEVWREDEILVTTEKKNYTVVNLEDLFLDMNYPVGWDMYRQTSNLITLKPPGVRMFCMYGVGIATPEALHYAPGKFPDGSPKVRNGDGDGTVNLRSLEVCARWQQNDPNNINLYPFKGVDHMTVLSDKDVLEQMSRILVDLMI